MLLKCILLVVGEPVAAVSPYKVTSRLSVQSPQETRGISRKRVTRLIIYTLEWLKIDRSKKAREEEEEDNLVQVQWSLLLFLAHPHPPTSTYASGASLFSWLLLLFFLLLLICPGQRSAERECKWSNRKRTCIALCPCISQCKWLNECMRGKEKKKKKKKLQR